MSSLSATTSHSAPLSVRLARADEASALSAIARAAKARWGYPLAWLAAWEPDLTFTPATLEHMTVLVAEWGGVPDAHLLGVAALKRRAADWSLEHFWVAPAAEGQGVGRALFTHLVRVASVGGGGVIEILSDPHAVGFYERMGARPAGSVPAPMPAAPARLLPRLEYHVPAAP